MKRASVTILIVFLLGGIGVIAIRSLLRRQASRTAQATPATQPIVSKTNIVSYGGVSFTFDPSLAPDVKSETIPASTEGKPSDIWPEHPGFTLRGSPRSRAQAETDPQIRVFALAKFREAVTIASKEDAKSVVYPPNPPDWTLYFDEEIRVLKALVAEKPKQSEVKTFITKVRGSRSIMQMGNGYPQMPLLPMWEATQAFIAQVRYLNFKNGKGVFFLTQWDTETEQITNEGLEYAYQGITDDGRYYVYAEFSVAAPFLSKDDDPEVVAWNEKNYLLPHKSKEYQNYLRPVLAKLEALPANKFQPNLELLEQLIQSLEVQSK